MTKHLTDENFQQEVIEASKQKPVLVDFYAVWCGPCKMQGPIIDELAEEIGEEAVIGKLNTEEAVNVSERYGIMSIPTLIIFRNGEPKETFSGLRTKEDLKEAIKKFM